MVGSGLSKIQRSKGQKGRYGSEGGKRLEKYLTSWSADLSWLEIKNLNTAPGISSESKFSPEGHVVSTIRGNITKLALDQHSRPQSLSVLVNQKKRWALRMMVKRTCAHAQWRKPAFKQPNGSISVRYNNLLDMTLCMHEFDASFERRRIWGALKTFYRSPRTIES